MYNKNYNMIKKNLSGGVVVKTFFGQELDFE